MAVGPFEVERTQMAQNNPNSWESLISFWNEMMKGEEAVIVLNRKRHE